MLFQCLLCHMLVEVTSCECSRVLKCNEIIQMLRYYHTMCLYGVCKWTKTQSLQVQTAIILKFCQKKKTPDLICPLISLSRTFCFFGGFFFFSYSYI